MAKTLIPKTVELTKEKIKEIKEKFPFLTNENIKEMEYWNGPHSPYSGTIVDNNDKAQYQCYPYPNQLENFLTDYPGSEIWE